MSLNLDATLGAMHIGTSLAGYLLGLTTAQAVYYYTQYPDDSLIFKVLVGWTVLLDFFHQICIEHNGYEYQVTNWNNPAAILDIFWSLIAQVFVIGLLTVTAQMFYVWRLWKLSNSYILPAIVSMLALAQFGLLLFYCKEILGLASLAEVGKVTYLQKTINALSGATDVLIALAMVWHLRSIKTGFEKTDSILGRLMIFCVNSGALTSITAIWVIISVSAWPTTYVYMTFYFMLGRLYSNSLLATLNMRNAIRKSAGRSAGTHSTLELGSVSAANMFGRPTDHTHSAGVVVRIDQEIERDGKLNLVETDSEYKHNNVKATAF